MRDLSVGKQELREERRGMEGILDFMSGWWGLYGSPSPPFYQCERQNKLSRFATTQWCWSFTLCFKIRAASILGLTLGPNGYISAILN